MIDRKELNQRLKAAYDSLLVAGKIHSKADLARALQMNVNSLNSAFGLQGRAMTKNLLLRIADAFPDVISRRYMETGEGPVAAPAKDLRPHFAPTAAAGFLSGFAESDTGDDLRAVADNVPDYDFTINAAGDSMLPLIHDGDLLFCRRDDDRYNPPIDRIVVLDTTEGAVVKVLRRDDDGLILHSLNPRYADRRLDTATINGIARVVAVLHNTNNPIP